MAGREGTVEPGGGFGEFDWRQLEKSSRGADEFGGNIASATGAARVGGSRQSGEMRVASTPGVAVGSGR